MSWVVALTGGIGSGKSTVSQTFASFGIPVIDADVIARQIIAPETIALNAIVKRYGNSILFPDRTLNRALLRQYIFQDFKEKTWLNKLLHPLIHQKTQEQILVAATMTAAYILWVVPLLVENKLHTKANRILVINVSTDIQVARTMARDGVTRQHVTHILEAQASEEQRLGYADDVIDNNGTFTTLLPRIVSLHHKYLILAKSARQNSYNSIKNINKL